MSERLEFLPPEASDVVFIGAIAAIFRGELDLGIANVSSLANEGYERAAATYAQLLAYQEKWEEVGEYAGLFLLNPASGSTHDVYLDSWRLLTLSAMHTDKWHLARKVATQAKRIYANAFTDRRHPRLNYLNTFSKFIKRTGRCELPYPTFPAPNLEGQSTRYQFNALAQYYADCAQSTRAWSNTGLHEHAARQDLYTVAMNFNLLAETVDLFKSCKAPPEGYNQLLFLAKSLMSVGAKSGAREILEMAIKAYIPHDLADVLPVAPLWDATCRQVTPLIRTNKVLLRERTVPAGSLHKIPADKLAAIESRNEHLLQLAKQASFVDIERWEEQLAGDEQNFDLRTLLIVCYYNRIPQYIECAELHAKHVFWLIENAPHTMLAGDDYCMLIQQGQAALYQQGKELWLKALREPDTTTQVVRNAARYLRYDANF